MQVPPAGLPAVVADLERRIRKLAHLPIEDPSDEALFCLLCYEAFGCEGTMSARARDSKARDPYAPGSFHVLPDDTLVQFPLRGEGDELREVCGKRRWSLGSDSGLTRTDLTPQTEEMLAEKLRALSLEEVESRTMICANSLLERLRSGESVRKAHDDPQRMMEETAQTSGAGGVLAELSGPLTPDHPELTRVVVAVLIAAVAALPKEEIEAFSELWRDYGLMRWARKG